MGLMSLVVWLVVRQCNRLVVCADGVTCVLYRIPMCGMECVVALVNVWEDRLLVSLKLKSRNRVIMVSHIVGSCLSVLMSLSIWDRPMVMIELRLKRNLNVRIVSLAMRMRLFVC